MRKEKLSFMIDTNIAEFYEKLNKMTKKELKLTAEFMQSVEILKNSAPTCKPATMARTPVDRGSNRGVVTSSIVTLASI